MHFILHVLFFIVIIIIYLHAANELKTSEDLEIYELDYQTKPHLQEICEAKQPVLFEFNLPFPIAGINGLDDFLPENSPFDVCCIENSNTNENQSSIISKIPYKALHLLMKTDTEGKYISYNNHSFIDEASLAAYYYKLDMYLKPALCCNTQYDLIFGSKNSVTPLSYHFHTQRFIMVMNGKIRIKMTPWKSKRYFNISKNPNTLENTSNIQLWNPLLQDKLTVEKIKCLEFNVHTGYILYIPPYWFYTIQFIDDNTFVPSITYNNCVNYIVNSKTYFQHMKNTHSNIFNNIKLFN